jgi:hypothetical protein
MNHCSSPGKYVSGPAQRGDVQSASFLPSTGDAAQLYRDSGVASRATPWWEELECRRW